MLKLVEKFDEKLQNSNSLEQGKLRLMNPWHAVDLSLSSWEMSAYALLLLIMAVLYRKSIVASGDLDSWIFANINWIAVLGQWTCSQVTSLIRHKKNQDMKNKSRVKTLNKRQSPDSNSLPSGFELSIVLWSRPPASSVLSESMQNNHTMEAFLKLLMILSPSPYLLYTQASSFSPTK